MVVLDATAGNRVMWRRKEGHPRNPPNTIFMDKEFKLSIPPDIIADFRYCPFRDDVFGCVFFDPPYSWHIQPWHRHPEGYILGQGLEGRNRGTYYGTFQSKTDLLVSIYKAQQEFMRVSGRLCFKWNEYSISLWNILSLFKDWIIIQTKEYKASKKRSKIKTFWVTFSRSSPRKAISDNPENNVSDILLGSQVIENGATPTTN